MPNPLFDKLLQDFQDALAREQQIRSNYETGLIPSLERDLQACRRDLEAQGIELRSLRKWKASVSLILNQIDQASAKTVEALSLVPGDPPIDDMLGHE